jgi:hypothetical protein
MTKEMNECASACLDTHKAALQALKFCLHKGGKYGQTAQLLRLLDCAQICDTAAEFCIDDSAQCAAVANACAQVCEACARDSELFDDAEMRQFAEVSRYCAHACYRVVHAVPA